MLGQDPIVNDCVLVIFKDSLFPCSQFCNFTRTLFISSCSMERYFDEWEIVELSAYIVTIPWFRQNDKSLIKIRNRSGPWQESLGHHSLYH